MLLADLALLGPATQHPDRALLLRRDCHVPMVSIRVTHIRSVLHMLDRIRAAWSILRGTHKAIPAEASWYIGTVAPTFTIYPTNTTATATNVRWAFPQESA
jgi:hypothetical protein